MRRFSLKFCLQLAAFSAVGQHAIAQAPVPEPRDKTLERLGIDQYLNGSYSAAQQSLDRATAENREATRYKTLQSQEQLRYYQIISALKLGDSAGAQQAESLMRQSANPVYQQRLAGALRRYYFETGAWGPAIAKGQQAGIANFSNREIAEGKFQLAYSYFNDLQFDKAEPLFRSIRDVEGPYQSAGNYYYGLLAYHENRYDEAMRSFQRIADMPQYRTTVPYYIAEIYYFKGNRQKALSEALRLIKQPEKLYYDNELHLLAAQSLYEEQRFGEALPFFEHYYGNVDRVRKEELYEMAYCYYRVGEYGQAVEKFKPLSAADDSLGQTAMYLLGDCYLKTGDKRGARTAFTLCANMPYNPGQREAALLLAAKLSYEAGYTDEALDQVHTLLVDYPSSEFRGEAATLRSDLLSRSGDFAGALESLDGAAPGTDYNRIYQRAAYGLALERLLVNDVSAADSLLTRSLGRPQNPAYVAAAQFWKGETAYRLGHFEESLNALKSFRSETSNLQLRGVAPDATASAAALTMGYAAMALKDYVAAQRYFSEAKKGGGSLMASAALGEADAVLMQRQFSQAQALYEQAGSSDDRESDYAKMQRAILLGVQGKNTEKATLLQTLINRTPASAYESDARYELALARIADNRFAEAITLLQPLTSNRAYGPKALLRTGFAESEQNHDDAAIAAYRRVLSDFSGSTERSAALDALRAIYTERGTPEVYAGLLDQYGLADAGLDSAFYAAAEGRFAAGRYNDAIKGFNEYLTRYANGSFAPRAHYYVAASYDKIRDTTNALRSFDAVLSDLASEFTGLAASRAAILSESRGDTTAASTYYLALRNSGNQVSTVQTAFLGLARTSLALGRADAANAYADSLLSLPNLPEAVVNAGTLIQGNAASLLGNQDKAIASWGRIASVKQTYLAAEAGYKMAAAMYSQGRVADAEKAADHVVRLSGAPESWTVRSYLLLARIFADQKDFFNAKATLQSVVKNAKNPDLKAEAALQLEQVIQAEKGNSKLSAE